MRVRQVTTGTVIALSAFLLFTVEPLSSKELLPALGGSSAVWLTCLCFFQIALVLGYAYAALLARTSHQVLAKGYHAVALMLSLCWVLFTLHGPGAGLIGSGQNPTWTIFLLLTRRIGPPFLLLSATSPLLQSWLAQEETKTNRYRLFALSNAGSLLALISYPLLIEPQLALHTQRKLWATGFTLYALLSGCLLWQFRRAKDANYDREVMVSASASPAAPERTSSLQVLSWFFLGAVGTVQLCAVSAHLTENIAALPLLWVLPLGVYLLSLILAFEAPALYNRAFVLRCLVVLLASLGYLLSKTDVSLPLGLGVGIFLVEMFFACWFCHAEVYRARPREAVDAVWFYLVLAIGGAVGTTVAAVGAPLLFNANYDLPLAFALTAAAALLVTWRNGWSQQLLWGTSTLLCLVLAARLNVAYTRQALFLTRNFYGSLRVKQSEVPVQAQSSRLLLHGTIEHGMQWFAPQFRTEPLTYYGRHSGVGLALALCCAQRPSAIGVIGLGAGTLAAYGHAGDTMRFYEINPAVEQIAKEFFTYLRESKAAITVVHGDARQSLEREPTHDFDLLVVDAFSGDAIPVHLLTLQAVQLYRRHLRADGILAVHISNQYLDLAPVLRSLAVHEGLMARVVDSPADSDSGIFAARWVLLASKHAAFDSLPDPVEGDSVSAQSALLWTDDYSSLLRIVRWGGTRREITP